MERLLSYVFKAQSVDAFVRGHNTWFFDVDEYNRLVKLHPESLHIAGNPELEKRLLESEKEVEEYKKAPIDQKRDTLFLVKEAADAMGRSQPRGKTGQQNQ